MLDVHQVLYTLGGTHQRTMSVPHPGLSTLSMAVFCIPGQHRGFDQE